MIYIIFFICSVWIMWLAEKKYRKNRISQGHILLSLSAILPCILASLRADSIGTDVLWYVVPNFNAAKNFSSFANYIGSDSIEPLYALLVYISSKLFSNVSYLLFLIELLIVVPVYITLYKNRNRIQMWVGAVIFYLLIYNYTYSLIRQCIAAAFILLAFTFYCENKRIKALLLSICAIGFHSSSIVLAVIILMITNIDSILKSKFLRFIIIGLSAFLIINLKTILILLSAKNIIDIKYLYRVNAYPAAINYFKWIIMGLFSIQSIFVIKRKMTEKIDLIHLFPFLCLVVMIGGTTVSQYFGRLEYYFYFFYILTLSQKKLSFRIENLNSRLIFNGINIFLAIIFWIKIFWINNSFETIPYILR